MNCYWCRPTLPHTTLSFNSWPGSNALCGLSSRSGKPLGNEKTSSDRRLDRLREMEEQSDLSSSSLPLQVRICHRMKLSNIFMIRISLCPWEAKSTDCSCCALGCSTSPPLSMDTSCPGLFTVLPLYGKTGIQPFLGLFIAQRWSLGENCRRQLTWT